MQYRWYASICVCLWESGCIYVKVQLCVCVRVFAINMCICVCRLTPTCLAAVRSFQSRQVRVALGPGGGPQLPPAERVRGRAAFKVQGNVLERLRVVHGGRAAGRRRVLHLDRVPGHAPPPRHALTLLLRGAQQPLPLHHSLQGRLPRRRRRREAGPAVGSLVP